MVTWQINNMTRKHLEEICKRIAKREGVHDKLLAAIIDTESNWCVWACRYEPGWRWFLNPKQWSKRLHQTTKTEWMQQATSYGLCQVMGTVARELGFKSFLAELCDPEINLIYGAKKLKTLCNKYYLMDDVIAAYNAGKPRKKINDKYRNQGYVDKVNKNFTTRVRKG